jgi:hypothetical protein
MPATRATFIAVVVLIGSSCLQQQGQARISPEAGDLAACLQQYHQVSPDPVPANGQGARFLRNVIYAAPCQGLTPAGEQPWSMVVVAHDDKTLRVYFVGGLVSDRCDLLRNINVRQDATGISIALEAGADPTVSPASACSAVGQSYVTEITLSDALGTRRIGGPNNAGVIYHL